MKLGEIKLEALKIMFTNNGQDIVIEDMETLLRDEIYRNYLINMNGSINRCFSNIEDKGVLPLRVLNLDISTAERVNGFLRFNLNEITDFYKIDRIVYENSYGEFISDCEFRVEANILILPEITQEENYRLIYKPNIMRITSAMNDEEEVDVPDNIAVYIPYFIKGDLFRDDEPDEANEARNWFEQAMQEFSPQNVDRQNSVKTIYKIWGYYESKKTY